MQGGVIGAVAALGYPEAKLQGGIAYAKNTPVTPTIAGAVGNADELNVRLAKIIGSLHDIAGAIGCPSPIQGSEVGQPPSSGHVHRLAEAMGSAHRKAGEIEDILGAIQRSLG